MKASRGCVRCASTRASAERPIARGASRSSPRRCSAADQSNRNARPKGRAFFHARMRGGCAYQYASTGCPGSGCRPDRASSTAPTSFPACGCRRRSRRTHPGRIDAHAQRWHPRVAQAAATDAQREIDHRAGERRVGFVQAAGIENTARGMATRPCINAVRFCGSFARPT